MVCSRGLVPLAIVEKVFNWCLLYNCQNPAGFLFERKPYTTSLRDTGNVPGQIGLITVKIVKLIAGYYRYDL